MLRHRTASGTRILRLPCSRVGLLLVVQRLLVESFENTGRVGAVSQSSVGLRNDFTVVSDLREFQGELLNSESSDATATAPA